MIAISYFSYINISQKRCTKSPNTLKRNWRILLNIAFWSEEDGCGTTSSMAAVASVCSDAWKFKTILLQSRNQDGDLCKKLGSPMHADAVREESLQSLRGGLDFLLWQEKNSKLNRRMLQDSLMTVVKGRMYYLPQGTENQPLKNTQELKKLMWQIICRTGKIADMTFIDCGSGSNALSEHLLERADVVVVNLPQERQGLDAYFKKRHAFRGKVIYLVNQYQHESACSKRTLNRLYRLEEEELGVILHNSFFRHAGDKGKIERFVRRNIRCSIADDRFCFMQELVRTAYLIVKAGRSAAVRL